MIYVYVNYPNPHFTTHKDSGCPLIQMHQRDEQRYIQINEFNLEQEIRAFSNREITFKSTAKYNDLWLEIDLGNDKSERDLLLEIKKYLGKRYAPLNNAAVKEHC